MSKFIQIPGAFNCKTRLRAGCRPNVRCQSGLGFGKVGGSLGKHGVKNEGMGQETYSQELQGEWTKN